MAATQLMLQTSGSVLPMFSLVNTVCEAVPLLPLGQGPALLACRINMAEGTVSLSVASQRFAHSSSSFPPSLGGRVAQEEKKSTFFINVVMHGQELSLGWILCQLVTGV